MSKSTTLSSRYRYAGTWAQILSFIILSLISIITNAQNYSGKIYQHWADGDLATGSTAQWQGDILQANKSDYFEGEIIPHIAVLQGNNKAPLETGKSYVFTVVYNYYQSNTNAGGFAYLTTYNKSRKPVIFSSGLNKTPSLDIIDPSKNLGGMKGDFYSNNADVTDISAPAKSGSGTFDNTVTVKFTYTGITGGYAEIYYGLYIAKPGEVPDQGKGKTIGAHAWTGGSLQTTLSSSYGGASSIQLSPSAIIEGVISGTKYSDLNNNHTRDAGEPGLQNWKIYLDNNNNNILDVNEESMLTDVNGNFSFSVTPDADRSTQTNDPYYVKEVQQSGWTKTQPLTDGYGPITITALNPQSTGNIFGNFTCNDPAAPTGKDQTECSSDPVQTLTATATAPAGSSVKWYNAATNGNVVSSPTLNKIGTVTYYAASVDDITKCESSKRTAVKLTINETPTVKSDGDETECDNGQTLTANATVSSGATLTWYDAATNGNVVSDPSLTGVGTKTYYAQASLGDCKSGRVAVKLTINETPTVKSDGDETECDNGQTLTANATVSSGATLTWYDAATNGNVVSDPSLTGVGTKTYYAQASLGDCKSGRVAVKLTINETPTVKSDGDETECDNGQTLTANATVSSGATLTWYDAATNGNVVSDPSLTGVGTKTYYAQASLGDCKSGRVAVKLTINETPGLPDITITEATLCGELLAPKLTVNKPVDGKYILTQTGLTPLPFEYPKDGNTVEFKDLVAGKGFSLTVENKDGCISSVTDCNNYKPLTKPSVINNAQIEKTINQQQATARTQNIILSEKSETKVTVAPNPYNDKIRFNLRSTVSGQGALELYNMMGQKVKTVYQGFIEKDRIQTIEYSVPNAHRTNLIYLFRVGDQRVSGKLIH